MGDVLDDARHEEERYEWLKAADVYRKTLTSVSETDFPSKGEICESLAHAMYKAAFQAENNEEFKARVQQSAQEYEKAKHFYGKCSEPDTSKALRCDAMIAFAGYWLASKALEKKRLIDECWTLTKQAIEGFRDNENPLEYGKTYVQLSQSAFWREFFQGEAKFSFRICDEARRLGEQAILSLSSLGDPYELGKAYFQTAIYTEVVGVNTPDQVESEKYCKKAQSYALKAKQVCEEAALLESYWLIGYDTGSDESIALLRKRLDCACKARDRFATGWTLTFLSISTFYRRLTVEDAEERVELLKEALNYAEKAKNEFQKLSWISPSPFSTFWVEAPYTAYYFELASDETNVNKRRDLLQKAVESAQEGFRRAEDSGCPYSEWYMHNTLSKVLVSLAKAETDLERKRGILDEALEHRMESRKFIEQAQARVGAFYGDELNRLADIKYQIANLTSDSGNRKTALQEAIRCKDIALDVIHKDIMGIQSDNKSLCALFGNYQYEYGEMLKRLYELTGDREDLAKAIEAFHQSAETSMGLGLMSRSAECRWRSAQAYDVLGEHSKAADDFALASEDYKEAAVKIPKLEDFYEEHSIYMQAWSEIEKARYHVARSEYDSAESHFGKSSELHKSLQRWNYLAPNYMAWAELAHAEELSRTDQSEKAIEAFEHALNLFGEAKKSLQKKLGEDPSEDEREMATGMLKATELRRKYCKTRIAIEEARILDRIGDHQSASEKYGSAAEVLEKAVLSAESGEDKKELGFIACLSRAWQKMMLAETEASPELYLQASQAFERAKELGTNEKTRMLSLGHSRFCQALEAGTRFADTKDMAEYSEAMRNLESAANYYLRADFQNASEYTKATRFLFDSYVHMDNAARETDPDKKTRLYMVAEKVLQASAEAYSKAGNPSRKEQALKLLETAREQRKMAISLAEVLHAPMLASTKAFAAPTASSEKAVGLERFEHAEVNANLILSRKELKLGESLDLEIELANLGKGQALLNQIERIVPEGFELTEKPELYRAEGCNINLRGRRLDPLNSEEIKLSLRPKHKGSFTLAPSILYVDENGNAKSHRPEPQLIEVSQVVLADRIGTGCQDVDDLLFGGIPQNYAVALTAPSCDERGLLIKNFLETGARHGEFAFYVTTDLGPVKTLAEESWPNFYIIVCNPQANMITRDSQNVFKLKGVENLTEISIALTSAIRKLDTLPKNLRRICLDIVSDVLLQHRAVQTRRWLAALVTELKSKGFTTMAVIDPRMHLSEELHAIIGLFDGEISIYEKETGKGLAKFLKIKKLSNQDYLENELLIKKEHLQKPK